jgi:maleate cis-trans isomerase
MGAYGWRASIGLIVPPATNETLLSEAFRMIPEGISLCVATLGLREISREQVDLVLENVRAAAQDLADRKVDVVVHTGVAPASLRGDTFRERSLAQIRSVLPAATPLLMDMDAILEALNSLKIQKLALVSPYTDAINRTLAAHLEEAGLRVATRRGLGLRLAELITKPTHHTAYRLAREAFAEDPTVDGLFISCPQWPVVGLVAPLERDLGVPVVAHLPTIYWGALRRLGLHIPITGFGRLLEEV